MYLSLVWNAFREIDSVAPAGAYLGSGEPSVRFALSFEVRSFTMGRPGRAVITTALLRYGVSLTATATLLAGCGGSQSALSPSPQELSSQQSHAEATYTILHTFGNSSGDGTNPAADLIDVKGTLYGPPRYGGSTNSRTVFSITKTGDVI